MDIEDKNITDPLAEDEVFENNLRPRVIDEYIGQSHIKENLLILLRAAQKRKEPIEHLMLYGPPGLGKTTLAHVIANEMNAPIRVTSGPAIERAGDLASILTNMNEGEILFIDEIHRINRHVEEVLYPAMEDYAIDLIIGKGPAARTMRIDLPKFTIIGATTRVGLLSSPLRDRFGAVYRLDFYNNDELARILGRSSKILNLKIDDAGIFEIAQRSRRTPRIANRLLRRVRDFSEVMHKGSIDREIAHQALSKLDIDGVGLDKVDKLYLSMLIEKFGGGPVGLETISAAIGEDKDTIEDVVEPFLLQLGFINRTKKGRVVTPICYEHLKINLPAGGKKEDQKLF
ncbi:MAG: Holliday junction branch migration DNA helicase RuvB [Patescibacteria group bacterium]